LFVAAEDDSLLCAGLDTGPSNEHGMRLARVLIAVATLAAALGAPRASLAATHQISVRSNFFDPVVVHANAGDTVEWQVVQGSHNVTSYGGGQSWSSGLMSSASPPFTQVFGGGPALFRCTLHSTILSGGTCDGMCGAVTDKVGGPATPVITSPAEGSTNNISPVNMGGTGEAWTTVRLKEGATDLGEALVTGDGTWSVPVMLPGGEHTVTAMAVTVDGVSSASDSQTFTVGEGPDTQRPVASITSPPVLSVSVGPVNISGSAQDNKGVARVIVNATSVLLGTMTATALATCAACPGTFVGWTATLTLSPGIYTVSAVAVDTATPVPNVSDPSNSITIIVL
jgi:plastocyanin